MLNAKDVIESFAEKGIICSVLKPEKSDSKLLTTTFLKLATNADIIILDWKLNDTGQQTLQFIENIITNNVDTPHQLRLIVVYTGEPKIVGIIEKIQAHLQEKTHSPTQEGSDNLSLKFESVRIAVFAKPETEVPAHLASRKIQFSKLADTVTEEFTMMTAGLVSNVVMESLAQVRKNTHKVLCKLSPDLDAPYLTHRALQVNPEIAENDLTSLVAEELQAILEEAQVGDNANLEAIEDWIKSKEMDGVNFVLNLKNSETTLAPNSEETLLDLLQKGYKKTDWVWTGISNSQRKADKPHKLLLLTKMFNAGSVLNQSLDESFAFVTSMRSFYGKDERVLTQGTIVKEVGSENNRYWICVQPRCDTFRITDARAFPFLPLEREVGNKDFNIVLQEDNQFLRFRVPLKPFKINFMSFEPCEEDKERILTQKGVFHDTNGSTFEWVGELRQESAQRISNKLAANLSRVGVNESQWLRRWAAK